MPCYDPRDHERTQRISYIQDPAAREMTKKMNDKINSLTAMLCSLCQQVEQVNAPPITGNIDLQNWWGEHKAHDKARFVEAEATFVPPVDLFTNLIRKHQLAAEELTEHQLAQVIREMLPDIQRFIGTDGKQAMIYLPWSEAQRWQKLYNELLNVVTPREGETRHETALHYLRTCTDAIKLFGGIVGSDELM